MKASEFEGNPQANGIQPPVTPDGRAGHLALTASEKLTLMYRTGQIEDTTRMPDNVSFQGLLPLEEQKAARAAESADKGVEF